MTEDKDTINVQVSMKNKEKLEEVRRELERVNKDRFSLDKVLHHILRVYGALMKVEKRKGKSEEWLQKL